MLKAPIPLNEEERIAELRALRILDTPPEERFDRLVQLAAHLFGVPIAYIAMVDSDRQWFKSKCGLTDDQTGRDISFCGHAILNKEPLVINDATKDERFADNPLVVGEPHVRLYVGCPLRGPNGHNVGTICIVDNKPREINDSDIETLKRLGAMAERELDLLDLVGTQQRLIKAQRLALTAQERLAGELAEAEAYVRSLLPQLLRSGPVQTDYELIASSELGGDLFGYHWIGGVEEGCLAMYLLDVCGHGVGASLLSVSVANTLLKQTLVGVDFRDPAAVLAGLNVTYPMEENRGRFITAWYGVYDPRNRTLRHASAGHPPVIAMGLSDNPKTLGHSGLILGVDPKTQYENEEQTMPPGARLWVYSDGAIEARSPQREEFGIEGLACIMAEANDVPDRVAYVIRKIREFSGQQDFEDDLSLLAVTFV